jgi:hypothetical protein
MALPGIRITPCEKHNATWNGMCPMTDLVDAAPSWLVLGLVIWVIVAFGLVVLSEWLGDRRSREKGDFR